MSPYRQRPLPALAADPIGGLIFECSEGHFLCCYCNDKRTSMNCPVCSTETSIERSIAMEHVMESIVVPCSNTKYGCTAVPTYHRKEDHEQTCRNAQCFCPESSCSFSGITMDLLDHLTTEHKFPSTVLTDCYTVSLHLKPGFHVLRRWSSHFFLVSMASEPFGYAISVVCVQTHHNNGPKFTCSMNYNCSMTGYYESSSCTIRKSSLYGGLPKGYDLILPKGKISDDRNGIMLRMAIQGHEVLDDYYNFDTDDDELEVQGGLAVLKV
ncbi:hypothetical protein ACQJBY_005565 [Aegilops geniculata]